MKSGPDGLPIPSSGLRFKVSGHLDIERFLEQGLLGAESIRNALGKTGKDMNEFHSILDFGCGCGRVIRHWQSLKNTQVFGTDYNEDLIAWCRKNLPFAQFTTNRLSPPLPFEDQQFDLVYTLSVFTHLPENLQFDWMRELKRILKPGGLLIFSTHGEYYLNDPVMKPAEKEQFQAGNIVVINQEIAGTNFCGTFHPRSYVEKELTPGFEIVEMIPEGAKGNPHQDLYIFRKL